MPSIISGIEDFDDKVKQVLGNLLRLAEQHEDNSTTNAVRVVLNAFDPAKDAWVNNKAVAQVLRTKLDLAAGFLGIPLIGPNQGVYFSNREKLAKRIVREIVALYPSVCNECNHEYQVDFGESPPMRCYICLQGSHKCEEFTSKKEIQSDNVTGVHLSAVWLCTQCYELNNPYPTESKPKSKPATGPATPAEAGSQAVVIDESFTASILQKTAALSEELSANEVAEEKKDEEKKDEEKKVEELKPESTPPNKSKDVCSRFRVGTCQHGVSGKTKSGGVSHCKFTHPSRCKRYMRYGTDKENGCTLGKECTKLHTKLCPSSVNKMECLDQKCTHAHLKGTRRSETNPKHGKKREQSHNMRDRRESYRRDDADKSRERPREKSVNKPRSRTKSTSHQNSSPNTDPFLEFRSELDNLRKELQTLRNGQDRTRKLSPQEELMSVKKELEEERRLNQKVRSAPGGRSPIEAILNLMQHSRQDYF